MIGKEKIQNALLAAISQAESEATAMCYASFSGLTRYANNYVHQNTHTQKIGVSFRAKIGDRIGVASTTGLEISDLLSALKRAEAIAKAGPPIVGLPPLPGPQQYTPVKTYVEKTAEFTPEQRARSVKTILDLAKANSAVASGLLSTGYSELALVNTSGLAAYAPLTMAELMTIIGDGPASGYSAAVTRDIGEIDFEQAGKTALQKCLAGKTRAPIEPGDYEVILEHTAVADALEWLNYIGFGSKSCEEGTSFLSGRKGQKLVGDNVTIYDDGCDTLTLGVGFDGEGVQKTKVALFENGVAQDCVHNTQSAAKAGVKTTGHGLGPAEQGEGALPTNLIFKGGDSTLGDMIASVKRGIYVTRFHYINGFIDTKNAVLTGMTRDGTFLIEDGKLTAGLPNMRFMQSFLEALSNVRAISADQKAAAAWWGDTGAYLTPALQIDKFRFIGVQKED